MAMAITGWMPTIAANQVQLENAKPGSAGWALSNVSRNGEIEGYASVTSVNRGGTVSLYVNTTDAEYSIEIYRMGWYSGKGARLIFGPISRKGQVQAIPAPDPVTGLLECDWTDPYVLSIPDHLGDSMDWTSGVYLAKLTASTSRKQNYIQFVVRDDDRISDYLLQSSVFTHQAYNVWGGSSLYTIADGRKTAYAVSFNRPYAGAPAGDFLAFEYNMVRFLEREGYDVTYCTDIDTHQNSALLLSHRGFLSVGHDEYWSWQMRRNVENARDAGVNLAFFGANTAYWQIRLEPSASTGAPDRTVVAYKEDALRLDPFAGDPVNSYLVTGRFRDAPVNRPEDALVGIMYQSANVFGDITVTNASHWIYAGTGLRNGDILPNLLGTEVDRVYSNPPAGIEVVAHSPFNPPLNHAFPYAPADMTVYTASSAAIVFASGTIYWPNGLDGFYKPYVHCAAQRMTRNLFARFVGLTSGQSPIMVFSAASGTCEIAAESIATARIDSEIQIADTSGIRVSVQDSAGIVRTAPILSTSSQQINFLIPPGMPLGDGTAKVSVGNREFTGPIYVSRVAPGIFSADGNGQGVARAQTVRVGSGISSQVDAFRCSSALSCSAVPIDLISTIDRVILVLYGTGVRSRSTLENVRVQIGGVAAPVLYAGPQNQFVGIDQLNVEIPRDLIGRGLVDVNIAVDGHRANTVQVNIN
jgi:uncharacterized protein (TIGR03437 family)